MAAIDGRLGGIAKRIVARSRSGEDRAWVAGINQLLADEKALDRLAAESPRAPPIPPIGGAKSGWMELSAD